MEPYQLLENELCAATSSTHVVACASGTAALHLALEALGLPSGGKVLVPDFTMVACPRAVVMAGLTPVFVDCDERLCMDPDLVERAVLAGGVVAIMPVHVYGRLCDMDRLCRLARVHDLPVVEDCAEAWGVNHPYLTAARCWSFYKNKIVAGEEGGAVGFLSGVRADRARQLRNLGFTGAHDYTHVPRGVNARLSNAHAQLIRHSLLNVGPQVEERRQVEGWYNAHCPAAWRQPPRAAVWVYDLRVPGMTWQQQDRVVYNLRHRGVEARHGFKPMSGQEEFRGCEVYGHGRADAAGREVVYLPVRPGVTTEEDVELAFRVVKDVLGT